MTYNNKYPIKISFGLLESYRITLSKYRKKTVQKFQQHFNRINGIFISKNSEYKDWIIRQLKDWPDTDEFIHTIFITENYVIDVIATHIPDDITYIK